VITKDPVLSNDTTPKTRISRGIAFPNDPEAFGLLRLQRIQRTMLASLTSSSRPLM